MVLVEWRKRLECLRVKEVHLPPIINWCWIRETIPKEGVAPYLNKVFDGGVVRVTCTGWIRFFQLQELVFKELYIEFFATTKFRKQEEVDDTGNFTFCLGGRRHEYSLVELTWRLDLYN